MMNSIIRNRVLLLTLLIVSETILSVFLYFEDIEYELEVHLLESVMTLLLASIAIVFAYKIGTDRETTEKLENLSALAPTAYVHYDTKQSILNIPDHTRRLLNIGRKKQYSINDLSGFFSSKDWEEIQMCLTQPNNYKNFEKFGVLTIKHEGHKEMFFKYAVKVYSEAKGKLHGVIIWFTDFTESQLIESEIVNYLKKYRVMSFELDFLFNKLPFPIWRREKDGEIVFCNNAYKKLLSQVAPPSHKRSIGELDEKLKSLGKGEKNGNLRKVYVIDNKTHVINFTEIPLGEGLGSIGFSSDTTVAEESDKYSKSITHTLGQVLELSTNAIIVVDNKARVSLFNQAYVNLFNLDANWLSEKPSFSLLMDKLRENGKLPEMKDYKDYKDKQMKMLRELMHPSHDFMHLPGDQTLRVSVIPSQGGNTIFMYDNITDVLSVERSYNELLAVYKATISSLDQSIVIFGQNGKVKIYNDNYKDLWKLDADYLDHQPHFADVLDNHKNKFSSQKSLEELKSKIINCLEAREDNEFEVKLKNGKQYIVIVKSLPDDTVQVSYSGK